MHRAERGAPREMTLESTNSAWSVWLNRVGPTSDVVGAEGLPPHVDRQVTRRLVLVGCLEGCMTLVVRELFKEAARGDAVYPILTSTPVIGSPLGSST